MSRPIDFGYIAIDAFGIRQIAGCGIEPDGLILDY